MSPSENARKNIRTTDLINAIKVQPCLWDRKSEDYKDRDRRAAAWQEVYRTLEPKYKELLQLDKIEFGVQVTKKWYNIRDAYAKTRRSVTTKRPYLYSNQLSFMDAQYTDQNGYSDTNVTNELKVCEDTISVDDTEESMQLYPEDVYLDVDHDVYETPPKRPRLINSSLANKSSQIEKEDNLMKILENFIEKEGDEDRSFFNAVLSSVKSLSEDSKYEFRIGVLKLIQEIKEKDREGSSIKFETSCEAE